MEEGEEEEAADRKQGQSGSFFFGGQAHIGVAQSQGMANGRKE